MKAAILALWLAFSVQHVISKLDEDLFLSKCTCHSQTEKPDCDFSSLSKKKLKALIDKLMNFKIGCVSDNQFFTPIFTSTFSNQIADSDSFRDIPVKSKQSKQEYEVKADHSKYPPLTQTKVLASDCKIEGMSCSSKLTGVEYLFPTSVLTNTIIRTQKDVQYNEELKELMLELEEENDGCKFNLHGGYRSKDGFLNRPEPAVQWLKNQIIPRVSMMLSLSNSSHIPFTLEGWGAVLRSGHGQSMHVHPSSIFAGVYYVTAPPQVAKSGKSDGCLQFSDPRMGAAMAQVVRGKNIYGETFEICPDERGGLLIIFPSWLMHEVKPMPESYKGPRIGISFNVLYKPM